MNTKRLCILPWDVSAHFLSIKHAGHHSISGNFAWLLKKGQKNWILQCIFRTQRSCLTSIHICLFILGILDRICTFDLVFARPQGWNKPGRNFHYIYKYDNGLSYPATIVLNLTNYISPFWLPYEAPSIIFFLSLSMILSCWTPSFLEEKQWLYLMWLYKNYLLLDAYL